MRCVLNLYFVLKRKKRVFRFIPCPILGDFYDEAPMIATPKKKKERKLRGAGDIIIESGCEIIP